MKDVENLSIMEKAIHVARVPMFQDLAVDEIARLAAETVETEYEAGETIGMEHAAGHSFHILIEGVCETRAGDIVLRRVEAPDVFGLPSMLDIEDSDNVAVTVIEKSRALRVQKTDFEILLADYPQISLGLLRKLVRIVMELTKRVEGQQ